MSIITERPYGEYEGKIVKEYILTNSVGTEVRILNYGGTITGIFTKDRNDTPGNVVLAYESLKGYLQPGNPYFGCLIGRFCNRIAQAQFTLSGTTYKLFANNSTHSLHGGQKGFDKVIWNAVVTENNELQLSYLSRDGEEGYPGNLSVVVLYSLSDHNELKLEYTATTDKSTPVNLTNHCYFNLSAGIDATIMDHIVSLNGSRYIETDEELIPTGRMQMVSGGPMDFTMPKRVGENIADIPGGYDHSWILNGDEKPAATVFHKESGRYMEVFTTEPGMQFYTGNFLDGTLADTYNGLQYKQYAGLCLEAQHFPDSPNQLSFPNTILHPEDIYRQVTVYKFSVK